MHWNQKLQNDPNWRTFCHYLIKNCKSKNFFLYGDQLYEVKYYKIGKNKEIYRWGISLHSRKLKIFNRKANSVKNMKNKLTRFDLAIHLTLPSISGWVWYRGLDFYFFLSPPPHPLQFGRLVFTFSVFW